MEKRPIDRLTEREKDCLRRWLAHQTAKEIALDLGISPHAVEKRLKMARAKLGVSSSLDAARLLATTEGYQQAVPQSPDLKIPTPVSDKRISKSIVIGGSIMSLVATILIVIAAQASNSIDGASAAGMRKASWDETATFLSEAFSTFDKDRSGFLGPAEASALEPRDVAYRDKTLPTAPSKGERDPAAEAKWMAKLDTNRDGKVSRDEYVSYMMPWTLLSGIPKDWKPHADSRN